MLTASSHRDHGPLAVLMDLARHPHELLVRRWNWKSAVISSLFRASIFFAANLSAGPDAARAAFVTELVYRGLTAGFYGAITQAFRDARPAWAGMLAATILLPAVSHVLEFVVHWMRGTPRLAESLLLSVAFTALSTSFNLFAMRHGALTVGDGSSTLGRDLHRMPALVCGFAIAAVCATVRPVARVSRWIRTGRTDRKPPCIAPGQAHGL